MCCPICVILCAIKKKKRVSQISYIDPTKIHFLCNTKPRYYVDVHLKQHIRLRTKYLHNHNIHTLKCGGKYSAFSVCASCSTLP